MFDETNVTKNELGDYYDFTVNDCIENDLVTKDLVVTTECDDMFCYLNKDHHDHDIVLALKMKQHVVLVQIMNLLTKVYNMFKIIGKYNTDTFEIIDSASNYDDAIALLYEYKLSFGNKWDLEVVEE